MKILTTALMVSATMLAGVAQAGIPTNYPNDVSTQTQPQETRAQVVNELRAAQAAGLVSTAKDEQYPEDVAAPGFEGHAPASVQSK